MVAALLALLPPLFGGGIYFLERLAEPFEESGASLSAVVHAALVALAIVGAGLAARRRRRSGIRARAWVVLAVAIGLFSAGELIELLTRTGDSWVEEVLRVSAFVPFAVFALWVASSTSIVLTARRRRAVMVVVAGALFVLVALAELMPVVTGAVAWHAVDGVDHVLAVTRPFLDALLFLPLALAVTGVGLRHRCGPYVYIGLGILATLPADVLFHYDLLTRAPGLEEAGFACAAVALMYFAAGSFWDALRKEEAGCTEVAAP